MASGPPLSRWISRSWCSSMRPRPMSMANTSSESMRACSGQSCSHARHCRHSSGAWTSVMWEAPFLLASHVFASGVAVSRFVSAPVGQNAAHMPQPEQRSSSMTACPHTRVPIMTSSGCPIRFSASRSTARRDGRNLGSAPVFMAARRVCSTAVSWSKARSIASSAASVAASRPKSRADCRNARRSGSQEALHVARQDAGSLEETLTRAPLCQAASMVLASWHMSSATRFPGECSHFSQLPQVRRSAFAPADARSTSRLASTRPMQRTAATVSGLMALPAA